MRVAALYDIHGNLPALEAVIAEINSVGVDEIVVGGDVVPGPMPRGCLDLLLSLDVPSRFIMGNGDRETLVAMRGQVGDVIPEYFRESMRWNAAQLTPAHAAAMSGWPLTAQLQLDGLGSLLFCHATPRNDTEIFTSATAEEKLRPIFDPPEVDLIVCGHVHMQFDRLVGRTRVINAGSVGMPFQEAGAYWLLLGSEAELRRTEYDLQAAASRVRQTAYPLAEDFAAKSILNPPSRQVMIEAFSKAELS
jgi:predicted phosphodiesterase